MTIEDAKNIQITPNTDPKISNNMAFNSEKSDKTALLFDVRYCKGKLSGATDHCFSEPPDSNIT